MLGFRERARETLSRLLSGQRNSGSASGAGFCFIDGMSFSRLSFRSALLAVNAVALSLSFDSYNSDAQTRASMTFPERFSLSVTTRTMLRASPSSSQGKWLANDLAKNSRFCTLAYFRHPHFSSGPNPVNGRAELLWDVLASAGVDVVVVGHDHIYERFTPMAPDGSRLATAG